MEGDGVGKGGLCRLFAGISGVAYSNEFVGRTCCQIMTFRGSVKEERKKKKRETPF